MRTKTYTKPEMQVCEIDAPQLLAASDPEPLKWEESPADDNEEMW